MSETYKVIKPFKGDGKQYKPGDEYAMTGAPFEHKLVGTYIKEADNSEYQRRIDASKRAMYRRRQKSLQPGKYDGEPEVKMDFECEECGFVAKSAAGLTSHARKHQEG